MSKVLDDLKKAIETSGRSRYSLCKETGILQSSLSRWINGETILTIDAAEKLAEALGMKIELTTNAKPAKGKAKRTTSKGA